VPQTRLVVGFIFGARLVLVRAEVLDLLAAVLDFGQAEGGARALEEVAEGGEFGEVFLFAGRELVRG